PTRHRAPSAAARPGARLESLPRLRRRWLPAASVGRSARAAARPRRPPVGRALQPNSIVRCGGEPALVTLNGRFAERPIVHARRASKSPILVTCRTYRVPLGVRVRGPL